MKDHFDRSAANWDNQSGRGEVIASIARSIEKAVPLNGDMKALEFGCGTGLLGFGLIDSVGHMTFLDTSEGMMAQVDKKIAHRSDGRASRELRDIMTAPWEARFDLIVSSMALHHVPDALGALTILAGMLNPRGYLALCDLEREDGTFHPAEMEVPHWGFDVVSLENHLSQAGLEKISTSTPMVLQRGPEDLEKDYPLFLTVFRK